METHTHNWLERTELLLGSEKLELLRNAHVLVVGLGGVGAYAAEMIARAGVGRMTVADADTVNATNINRQLYALRSTVGQSKAEVAARRCADIDPELRVHPICATYDAAHRDRFFSTHYDYIVDAIDLVSCKLDLIEQARLRRIPILTALGTGNKLDPTLLQVTDISKTSGCPLARVMRTALRKRGVKHLKVVYSDEIPTRPIEDMSISCRSHCICPPGAKHKCTERRAIPGSIAFVPSVAGLILAGEVVKDLCVMPPKKAEQQENA